IERRLYDEQLPASLIKLIDWIADYYPSPYGSLLQSILPQSLLTKPRTIPEKTQNKTSALPELTDEQRLAVNAINNSSETTTLLHGDTGTGKTRVYMELASQALRAGRSALILTPEIGLTPQL